VSQSTIIDRNLLNLRIVFHLPEVHRGKVPQNA
jgi:hypothetical protein